MRYFFITQDKNLPGSIQYRDFDINGSRHVFSKEDSSQLDSVVALYLAGDGNEARWDFLQHPEPCSPEDSGIFWMRMNRDCSSRR